MKRISLVYFGTPDFSAEFLKLILEDKNLPLEVKLVVTQSDQPIGRKKIITPTPVKKCAQEHNLDVYDSSDLPNLVSIIKEYEIDLALLFAYGKIIKNDLLKAPKYGFWNIHPSLLPKYRGTSPMTYPIILGDDITGVTLMKMDEQMDHGSVIAQKKIPISPSDYNQDLQKKSILGAFELFKKFVPFINILETTEQDHTKATYTRPQTKEDGYIPLVVLKKAIDNKPLAHEELPIIIKEYYLKNPDLLRDAKFEIRNSSKIVYDYFRGLYPWPGIWTLLANNKRLKITDVQLKAGTLVIKRVQQEGKNEILFSEFIKHNEF